MRRLRTASVCGTRGGPGMFTSHQTPAGGDPPRTRRAGPSVGGARVSSSSGDRRGLRGCSIRLRTREPRDRGLQPPHAAGAGCDGPRLREGARHQGARRDRLRVRGPLHPRVQGHLRRDPAPLPAAPPGGASDVPTARDRPQRHRDQSRRGLQQPRHVHAHVHRDRRRPAHHLPLARSRSEGRPGLLREGLDATEQFRRSQARPAKIRFGS